MEKLIQFIVELLVQESTAEPAKEFQSGYSDNTSSRIFCILVEPERFSEIFGSSLETFMATLPDDVASLLRPVGKYANIRKRLDPMLRAYREFGRSEVGQLASEFAATSGIQQGDEA